MASTIDITKPADNGLRLASDIRDLALAAKNDIEALQAMQSTGSGTGVNFYLTGVASGISNYDVIQKLPNSAIEATKSCIVNNNTVLLAAYILDAEVNRTLLNGGEWAFDFFHYVSSVHDATHLTYEVYKRASDNTETLLFSADSETITALTVQNYITKTIQQGFTVVVTDKLVLKIYASTSFNGNITVYLVHSGTLHYSHILSPLVYTHNELESKQGGVTNEYYHLTAAEHSTLVNLSGTNTGDETQQSVGDLIANATSKSTPIDADYFGLMDSAAANILKKVSWLNIKTSLKTYFDTIYQTILVSGTSLKTINGVSLLGAGDVVVSGSGGRTMLVADTVYYIRLDGSDSNTGTLNTAGGAWLTIQHAFNVLKTLDIAGYNVTLKVNDGDYTSEGVINVFLPVSSGGVVTLEGNTSNLTAVSLKQMLCENQRNCKFVIDAFMFNSSSSTTSVLILDNSFLYQNRICYNVGGTDYIIILRNQSELHIIGATTYSKNTSNVAALCLVTSNSCLYFDSITLTIQNDPTFNLSLFFILNNSFVSLQGITMTGSFTGSYYNILANSGSSFRHIDGTYYSS